MVDHRPRLFISIITVYFTYVRVCITDFACVWCLYVCKMLYKSANLTSIGSQ